MRKAKAFTLIELLTVMAITAVLMTLIVVPIFQSVNVLRTGQAFADAQDKGRLLVERISREVGNAVSVRGGTTVQTPINTTNIADPNGYNTTPVTAEPSVPSTSLILRVPGQGTMNGNIVTANGPVVEAIVPNAKLDLVPPAQGKPDPTLGPGVFRDPNTGKVDPTLHRPKGDINLPVAPGATIVRYWIGLARAVVDPGDDTKTPVGLAYNEPYSGLLMARNGDRDNLYVLRRAEVQPYVYRNNKNSPNDNTTKAWRPNLDFFRSDDGTDTQIQDLDDPRFFIPDQGQIKNVTDATKNRRVLNWQKASVVQTEVSRYDMIRPVTTGPVAQPTVAHNTDAGGQKLVPQILPLIQFRPVRVASSPATGSAAARPNEAVEGADRIGPDTYKTQRGLLQNAIVRYYPSAYAPGVSGSGAYLEVAGVDATGVSSISFGQASADGLDVMPPKPNNFMLFNSDVYEQQLTANGAFPFTLAATSADTTDLGLDRPTQTWTGNFDMRQIFTPFRVLTATGTIVTSFPIEQVGGKPETTGLLTSADTDGLNLPGVKVSNVMTPTEAGLDATKTTYGDPGLLSAAYSPATSTSGNPYDPNRAFNRAYVTYPGLQTILQRFIDLRFVPNVDGTLSPLCPTVTSGYVHGFAFPNNGSTVSRVHIVPGSDEVYGPNQVVGTSYGLPVRYTRVTGNPGPNQYRLVYADMPEPTNPNTDGKVSSDSYKTLLGIGDDAINSGSPFDPATYNGNNVVSAMIQPRFKAGYLQLDSDPNVPLPVGAIFVKYRFQFNGPGDTFAVDYDTRELMQVLLTIKNFPQSNAPTAQTVTLKATATLRNALR